MVETIFMHAWLKLNFVPPQFSSALYGRVRDVREWLSLFCQPNRDKKKEREEDGEKESSRSLFSTLQSFII